MIRLHDGEHAAHHIGKPHGPWKLRPRTGPAVEAARRQADRDAAFQRTVVETEGCARTPAEIEEAYAYANRCSCHFWERWRCHVVQAEKRAPRTLV